VGWARLRSPSDIATGLLKIIPPDEPKKSAAAAAKRWFESNDGWLLILDNAADLCFIGDFLPSNTEVRTVRTGGAFAGTLRPGACTPYWMWLP
jgi:hypothetical protein